MTFIACCLAWVASLFARRIPGRHGGTYLNAGRHSWAHFSSESARAYTARIVTHPSTAHTCPPVGTPPTRPRPAPETWSPYAREVAEMETRPIEDTTDPVRPYVLVRGGKSKSTPEERITAHRRWELDMAARGLDVGPTTIHGVLVGTATRTPHMAAA